MSLTWINSGNIAQVSEAEIANIEKNYGIVFPSHYREMLKIHSGEDSEELETMIEASNIINMAEHGGEYYCLSYMSSQDLEKVFPIFESSSGNFYAFDYTVLNNEGEPTVIDIDHELECQNASEINKFDSFDNFIKKMSANNKLKI